MNSTGSCKSLGKQVEAALELLKLNGDPSSLTDNQIKKAVFRRKRTEDVSESVLVQALDIIIDARERASVNVDRMSTASKITEQIYLGPHSIARNRKALIDLGITAIISMAAECGVIFPEDSNLDYFYQANNLIEHKCSIHDVLEIIDGVYEFSSRKILNGDKVLIHCMQGKTRSAAAVTYIIAKRNNWSVQEAYDFCKSKRDIFIPEQWLESLQIHLEKN